MIRKAPLFILGLLALTTLLVAILLLNSRSTLPADPPKTTAAVSPASEPPVVPATPDETKATAPADAPVAIAAFAPPTRTTGTRLDAQRASLRPVAVTGKSPSGRKAEVDPSSFIDLAALSEGQTVSLPLIDGEQVEGVVKMLKPGRNGWTRAAGTLTGRRTGTFALASNGRDVAGFIQLPRELMAIEIGKEDDGGTVMVERALSDVICSPLPRDENEAQYIAVPKPEEAVQIYNSRPSATEVLYLDFDGETISGSIWNGGVPIVAESYNLSNARIQTIYNRVKDDWWPFNVNVTTDPAKYWNAPVGHRMRCIITPTNTAAPGSGGVAYLNSFRLASPSFEDDIPCWVFNSGDIGISEAISHELGHTMGLHHDGRTTPSEAYFYGHGSGVTSWAPIMGAGYNREVVQWSKGEYLSANQNEDDLAIITASYNYFGYAPDDAGNTRTSSASLVVNPATGVVNQPGNIERSTDADFFTFATNGGAISIVATPASPSPNLDIALELQNSVGGVMQSSNPSGQLTASLSANLAAGIYYVRVLNSNEGTGVTSGYTKYASIGAYTLSGSIQNVAFNPIVTSGAAASGTQGVFFAYAIKATGNPTSYAVTGTLPTGVELDPATGFISGVPTQSGTFNVTVAAINGSGTGSAPLAITITSPTFTLAQALDFETVTWTSGGTVPWVGQTTTTNDGEDAAQSGTITHGQESYVETTVTGPVTVRWQWKVSSEEDGDFLGLEIGGVEAASISGDVDWEEASVEVPAGPQTLRWVYRKNASISDGLDAGWLDQVTFESADAPEITSASTAAATLGEPFTFTITGSNLPASFAISSGTLPPGLHLNSASGEISGVAAKSGTFNLTVEATNNSGTGSGTLDLTVAPSPYSVGEALDNITPTWTLGGDADWFPQTVVKHTGAHALQAGPIAAGQTTSVSTTVVGPKTINFWWKTDCEPGSASTGDSLNFLVDGSVVATISGPSDWENRSIYISASGTRTITWTYRKDSDTSQGADTAWLDRVVITNDVLPQITNVLTASGQQGQAFSFPVTASNAPDTFSAENLPTGLNINPSSGVISGTPQVSGVFYVILGATNDAGTGTDVLTLNLAPAPTSLGEAVDAESLTWTTSTLSPWTAQNVVTHDSVDAVKTGPITHGGNTFLETKVMGPGVVSFYWRTDSQSGLGPSDGDSLRFSIGGTQQGFIKGNTGWILHTREVPAGLQTLRWVYQKDSSGTAGQDAGWVDQVVFSTATTVPQIAGPLTAVAYLGRPFTYEIKASHTPTLYAQTGLPDGLTLNPTTGVITGSVSVPGSAIVHITATNNSGTGSADLSLALNEEPPGANSFENATSVSGTFLRSEGTSIFANAETGEPAHGGQPAKASVWWAWRAPLTGDVNVTTAGSAFDTVLAVYSGTALENLQLIKANDDTGKFLTSAVKFAAKAGQTYYIAVDGVSGATGALVLNVAYAATGKYVGLLTDQAGVAMPALATIDLTTKFTFSGSLQFGQKKFGMKGTFNGDNFTGTVSRGKTIAPIDLSLDLDLNSGAEEISGTVVADGVTYELFARRGLIKADVPLTLPGPFTFVIEPDDTATAGLPRGTGYGTVVIDKSGKVKAAGTLGDGTKFSYSTVASMDKSWVLYLALYKAGGVCAGQVSIDAGALVPPLSANLDWRKTADAKAKLFPDGFPATTAILKGYRYVKPGKDQTFMPLAGATNNLSLSFLGSDITPPTNFTGTLDSKNKFTGGPAKFKFTFAPATGLFSGSFVDSAGNARILGGAILNGTQFVQDDMGVVTEVPIHRGAGTFFGLEETGVIGVAPTPP